MSLAIGADTMEQEQNSELTVDFHEEAFLTSVAKENTQILKSGFWFQLDAKERQGGIPPWGTENIQGLNRYVYVLNNPMKFDDPSGHRGCWDYAGCGGQVVNNITHNSSNL